MNTHNFTNWRTALLWLMGLTLATLSSPAVVNAVTTPSVAPGVTPSVLYYQADATGNLAAMTDERGQVAWRADVRPFGQGTANPQDYPLRFLDQPLDAEIGAEGGLYHLGARTYDPVTGRFLTTDPLPLIGITREEPQRFNRYAYGSNNPYRYMDQTGRSLDLIVAGGGVALAAWGTSVGLLIGSTAVSVSAVIIGYVGFKGVEGALIEWGVEYFSEPIPDDLVRVVEPLQIEEGRGRFTRGQDALYQLEGIERHQSDIRKGKRTGKIIDETKKSDQRLENELKKTRDLKDALDEFD